MADETTNEGTQSPPPAGALPTENAVPQSRFNQVVSERNAAREQMAELQRQIEEIKTAQLAEKEDFRTLYEETKATLDQVQPKASQVDEWRNAVLETVQAQIEQLPEDVRDLVPEYEDPRQTLLWLNKNAAKLTRTPAPNMHAGARGDDVPPETILTPLDAMLARSANMTTEQWQEQKKKQQARDTDPSGDRGILDRLRAMNPTQE
jgi:DNA repair exonuclease SbcCD ATPase subunit